MDELEMTVGDVIAMHPEYHAMLEHDGDDAIEKEFDVEDGQTNPFLHMGMHISICEQISTDRPPGVRDLHQTLCQNHGDRHTAEHRMMDCLGEVLWRSQREGQAPDEQHYLECVRQLL